MDQQTPPLVCASHTKEYIVMLLLGILLGAGATFAYYASRVPSANGNNSYQAGFDAAKKLVEESPIGAMFRTPDDIRSLSGVVAGISGNKVTLHRQSVNPFEDSSLINRMVIIDDNTKVVKLSQKDPKVFQAEMDAFMKKIQSGKASPQVSVPPEPFTSTPATLSDIATGDILNVVAVENIKTMNEFTASEIQIQ